MLIPVALLALMLQAGVSPRVHQLMRTAEMSSGQPTDEGWDRIEAVRELGDLGVDAQPAVPLLVKIAEDHKECIDLRAEALRALSNVDRGAAIPVLVGIAAQPTEDPEEDLSDEALQTLLGMREAPLAAIIDVFRRSSVSIESTNYQQRQLARHMDAAARRLAENGKPAVPLLVEALGEKNENVRLLAAAACGQMGVEARAAIPALVALLEERAGSVVPFNAAQALGKMGAEAITPELLALLGDRDERVRLAVATVVKELGPHGTPAVSAVARSLESSKDKNTQLALVEALGAVGPGASEACPVLAKVALRLQTEPRHAGEEVVRSQLQRAVEKAAEPMGCLQR